MKSQLISSSLLAAGALAPLASAAIHRHHARDQWDHPTWHHDGGDAPPSSSSGTSAAASATTLYTSTVKTVVVATTVVAPSSSSASSIAEDVATSAVSVAEAAPTSSVEADPVASSTSATSAAASVTAVSAASSSDVPSLSRKSGLSGYVGIADTQAFQDLTPYISWYSDYTPTTQNVGAVKGVGMLWGNGQTCTSNTDDKTRMSLFKTDVVSNSTPPEIMFGFYEPDCYCPMSSDMSTSDGTTLWNSLIAPLKAKGTILGSPSMCKQKDEDWLAPFKSGLDTDWDVTSLHINKNSIDGVKEDVEYYLATYGKPLWISEFACVDDQNDFTACTDQDAINSFISDAVDFFHANESVIAYGPSNGEGLGTVWPLTDSSTGELSATGQAYLSKIKSLS